MRKLNDYGRNVEDVFVKKANINVDIENGTFLGNIFYENHIKSIVDAVGWLINTYDSDALDVLNEWIEYFGHEEAWGFNIYELKEELEKAYDEILNDDFKEKNINEFKNIIKENIEWFWENDSLVKHETDTEKLWNGFKVWCVQNCKECFEDMEESIIEAEVNNSYLAWKERMI